MSSGRSAILLKLNNPPKQGNSWIHFWELKDILTVRSQVFVRFHFIESSDIPIRSALAHARIILRSGLQTEAEQEDETKLGETHAGAAEVIFTPPRWGAAAIIHLHLIQITGILINSSNTYCVHKNKQKINICFIKILSKSQDIIVVQLHVCWTDKVSCIELCAMYTDGSSVESTIL